MNRDDAAEPSGADLPQIPRRHDGPAGSTSDPAGIPEASNEDIAEETAPQKSQESQEGAAAAAAAEARSWAQSAAEDQRLVDALAESATNATDACHHVLAELLAPVREQPQGGDGEALVGQFCDEMERLQRVLQGLQHQTTQIVGNNQRLTKSYTTQFAQRRNAREHQAADEAVLRHLRSQIKKNTDLVEASQRRQKAYKDEVRAVNGEMAALQATVRQGVSLNAVQERRLNELTIAKEQATSELEGLVARLTTLREQITHVGEQVRTTDDEAREFEHEALRVREQLAVKKLEIDDAMRAKDKLDQELKALRDVIAAKMNDHKNKQEQIQRTTEEIARIEAQLKTQRSKLEAMVKDQELFAARADKLKDESAVQNKKAAELAHRNAAAAKELYMKESDLNKARQEIKKTNKVREQLTTKIHQLEEQRVEAEAERQEIRVRHEAVQKEMLETRRTIDFFRKTLEDLNRECAMLGADVARTEDAIGEDRQAETALKKARYNMEADIQRNQREATALGAFVSDLRHERDRYAAENTRLQEQCAALAQEIKQRETDLFEHKKKMLQSETRLKHQQNLYEALQSDRSLNSKQLLAAQFEVGEMKRQLKTMTYQINAFKEDIVSKEENIKREAAELDKLKRDTDTISDEIKSLNQQKELAQTYLRTQVSEESRLNQFVKEAERERSRQENALNVVRLERNQLAAQRIKQDTEISQVYSKLKTKRHALLRGERQYQSRVQQQREIRARIREARLRRFDLETQVAGNSDSQRRSRIRLEAQLLLERTRLRAMQEDAKNPVNMHRWRRLESKNPKAFELIQSVNLLQRKLIAKRIEEQEKAAQIRRAQESYLQLRGLLERQAGPEAVEQIAEFERILKDKAAQFRHMGTELNMYRAQVHEYRFEIAAIDKQLAELTDQYRRHYRSRLRQAQQHELELRDKESRRAMYNEGAGVDAVVGSDDELSDSEALAGSGSSGGLGPGGEAAVEHAKPGSAQSQRLPPLPVSSGALSAAL